MSNNKVSRDENQVKLEVINIDLNETLILDPEKEKLLNQIKTFLDQIEKENEGFDTIFEKFFDNVKQFFKEKFAFVWEHSDDHKKSMQTLKNIFENHKTFKSAKEIKNNLNNLMFLDARSIRINLNSIEDNIKETFGRRFYQIEDLKKLCYKFLPMHEKPDFFKISSFKDLSDNIRKLSGVEEEVINKHIYSIPKEETFVKIFREYFDYLKEIKVIELSNLLDFDENKLSLLKLIIRRILKENSGILQEIKLSNCSKSMLDYLNELGEVYNCELNENEDFSKYLAQFTKLEKLTLSMPNIEYLPKLLDNNKDSLINLSLELSNFNQIFDFTCLKNLTVLNLRIKKFENYNPSIKFTFLSNENLNLRELNLDLCLYETNNIINIEKLFVISEMTLPHLEKVSLIMKDSTIYQFLNLFLKFLMIQTNSRSIILDLPNLRFCGNLKIIQFLNYKLEEFTFLSNDVSTFKHILLSNLEQVNYMNKLNIRFSDQFFCQDFRFSPQIKELNFVFFNDNRCLNSEKLKQVITNYKQLIKLTIDGNVFVAEIFIDETFQSIPIHQKLQISFKNVDEAFYKNLFCHLAKSNISSLEIIFRISLNEFSLNLISKEINKMKNLKKVIFNELNANVAPLIFKEVILNKDLDFTVNKVKIDLKQ